MRGARGLDALTFVRDHGHDEVTPRRSGGEYAVIGELMLAGMRNEGRKPFQEDQWLEDDVGRAVAPGMSELEQDAPLVVEREALGGEGGARDVATEMFEPLAVVGLDANPRVQREPVDRRAQLAGSSGRGVRGDGMAEAPDALTCFRAQRDLALDRGGGEEGEQGVVLGPGGGVLFAGLGPETPAAQQAEDSIAEAMHELGDFLVLEWRSRVEDRTIQRALGGVDPVENERVKVNVQIERGAKPLNDVDGSGPGVGEAVFRSFTCNRPALSSSAQNLLVPQLWVTFLDPWHELGEQHAVPVPLRRRAQKRVRCRHFQSSAAGRCRPGSMLPCSTRWTRTSSSVKV